ncbi:hypothetical protein ACODNH_05330 [Haloarcula sp. NS06]|uniref:hypothetical protein n=1 Tax=Haloarcula sp. NS06 TaxID=3409688 RepID=UPI003DA737FE
MSFQLIEDWKSAVYHLEHKTGYFDPGEIRQDIARRLLYHLINLASIGLFLWALTTIFEFTTTDIITNLPGSFGAVLLAIAPLRQEIHSLHYSSRDPDGVEKERMPEPIVRNLKRLIDRTLGLLLVSITFLLQLGF